MSEVASISRSSPSGIAKARKRIGVVCVYPQEGWTSMDLVAEKLYEQIRRNHADRYEAQKLVGPWISRMGRLPLPKKKFFHNFDRLINRHFVYPRYLRGRAVDFDLFHVADHSYSMEVHALPANRTGVFCHDLDAYRSILLPQEEPRPKWYKAMTRRMLRGLQNAAVVFYTTNVIRSQIDHFQLIDPAKLVQAPYGVGEFFTPAPSSPVPQLPEIPTALQGRPFLLHVGTCNPRKRMDVLLNVFAAVRKSYPELALYQVGGSWQPEQQEMIEKLGIGQAIFQPGRQPQNIIAEFVRRARLVLLPSEREGFGLPVAETLACGAILVASDIPVLREVGGDAAVFAPLGDVDAWAGSITNLLSGALAPPAVEKRFAVASKYSWENHANTILGAYERLS